MPSGTVQGATLTDSGSCSSPHNPLAYPPHITEQPPALAEGTGTSSLLMVAQRSMSQVIKLHRGETAYGPYGFSGREPSVYFIEYGFVKAVASSREGKECLLGIFTVGDIVGDLGLRSDCRSESVVTMTPTRLRRMSSARLMAILDSENLREEFIRYLADRVQQQQQLITDFVTADSEYRLAAVLTHLAGKVGQSRGQLSVFSVRITHEELSAMVGTTRSRIGLFLRRFVEFGAVRRGRDGTLAIHLERMEKLRAAVLVARDERFSARSNGSGLAVGARPSPAL